METNLTQSTPEKELDIVQCTPKERFDLLKSYLERLKELSDKRDSSLSVDALKEIIYPKFKDCVQHPLFEKYQNHCDSETVEENIEDIKEILKAVAHTDEYQALYKIYSSCHFFDYIDAILDCDYSGDRYTSDEVYNSRFVSDFYFRLQDFYYKLHESDGDLVAVACPLPEAPCLNGFNLQQLDNFNLQDPLFLLNYTITTRKAWSYFVTKEISKESFPWGLGEYNVYTPEKILEIIQNEEEWKALEAKTKELLEDFVKKENDETYKQHAQEFKDGVKTFDKTYNFEKYYTKKVEEFYPKEYKKASEELKEVQKLVDYIKVIALNKANDAEEIEISSDEDEEEVKVVSIKSLRKAELEAEIREGKIKSSYRFLNRKPITNRLSFLASVLAIVISFFLPQNAPVETHIFNILLDGAIVGIATKIISCIIHRIIWKSVLKPKYRKIKSLNKTLDGYKKQAQKRYDAHREQTKKKYNEAFTKKRNEIIAVEKEKFNEKRAEQKQRAEKILKENWSSYLKENAKELSSLLKNLGGLSYAIWKRDLEGVPACYRDDIQTLSELKDYFQTGRAETIKEALNLYDSEKRFNLLYKTIDRLSESITTDIAYACSKIDSLRTQTEENQNETNESLRVLLESVAHLITKMSDVQSGIRQAQLETQRRQQESTNALLTGMLAQIEAQKAAADSITSEYEKQNKLLEEQNRKLEEGNRTFNDIKHGW